LDVLHVADLWPSRPACSVGEREAADAVAERFRYHGLALSLEATRAPTSPTWVPLLRALLRLWSVAFLAAGWPNIALGLALASVVGGWRRVAGLVRFVPLLGARANNVVATRSGTDEHARPFVVTAHLDTHPTHGAPLHRLHRAAAGASGALAAVAAAVATRPGIAAWRSATILVSIEAVATMASLAVRELRRPSDIPDDNTSGLIALVRTAALVADGALAHDVWIVATAGGTTGNHGIDAFLRSRPALRDAWLIDIDALGTGEMIAAPFAPRFRRRGTPKQLIRTVAAAAREAGDPLAVRRVRRPHSDAHAALRHRVGAISLTAGMRPPAPTTGPDAANAERAARIVDALARAPA
jgi:GNAT superfamily N-acetyltransferase